MPQPRIRPTLLLATALLGFLFCEHAVVVASNSRSASISRWAPLGLQRQWGRQKVTAQLTSSSSFGIDSLERFRGGAQLADDDDDESDEEEEEEEEEESEDEEEDDMLDDLDEQALDDAEDDDFEEENYVERAIAAWQKTPPLTKGYLSASFAAIAFGYLFHKNEFPPLLSLDWKATYSKLQIWRPFTAFLNFGPFGLGYCLTAQFVWHYMSTLERLHHSNPYDFWIMIFFGQLSMVVGYTVLKLSPKFLGHNLSTFLVYIWSRFHEGADVNVFGLFNTKAELLPWFFLAQTFLLEGEPPTLDFLGIVFGHVYYHLKSVGLLRAPQPLVAWYKGDSAIAKDLRSKYRTISEDFELGGGE